MDNISSLHNIYSFDIVVSDDDKKLNTKEFIEKISQEYKDEYFSENSNHEIVISNIDIEFLKCTLLTLEDIINRSKIKNYTVSINARCTTTTFDTFNTQKFFHDYDEDEIYNYLGKNFDRFRKFYNYPVTYQEAKEGFKSKISNFVVDSKDYYIDLLSTPNTIKINCFKGVDDFKKIATVSNYIVSIVDSCINNFETYLFNESEKVFSDIVETYETGHTFWKSLSKNHELLIDLKEYDKDEYFNFEYFRDALVCLDKIFHSKDKMAINLDTENLCLEINTDKLENYYLCNKSNIKIYLLADIKGCRLINIEVK